MSNPQPPRAQRYPLLLPLRVLVRKFIGRLTRSKRKAVLVEDTITENISSSGCYFQLSQQPEIGSKVRLEIAIKPLHRAQGGRVLCKGRVVRVETREGGKVGVACTFDHYRLEHYTPDSQV